MLHMNHFLQMLKLLVDHRISLDARDQDGKTPLHVAAEYVHNENCNQIKVNHTDKKLGKHLKSPELGLGITMEKKSKLSLKV